MAVLLAGRERTDLSEEIERLGLRERVISRKCKSDEELATLYRGALAFMFPSLYEGFGLPPLEAMACGTPVLASKAAAIPEVLGDAGLLVDPCSVEEIAAHIRVMAEDSELRKELRAKGLVRAKKYTWDKTVQRIGEALELATDSSWRRL